MQAGSDRDTAESDRDAGADERNWAERDRETASADRGAGALERTRSEADRATALADRGAGAGERADAGIDRTTAFADRGASAQDRAYSSLDDLTGAYLRDAGFQELDREIARVRRSQEPMIVVFADVDGLKAVNDCQGHAAGDQLLVEVATAFRATLRAHDLVIRYGGDEFVCAISGLTMAAATQRLTNVNAALLRASGGGSVTIGMAELQPADSAADLVARADAALYRERQRSNRFSR
jgi:diguanylate cyclase (GGDEF)-like protein